MCIMRGYIISVKLVLKRILGGKNILKDSLDIKIFNNTIYRIISNITKHMCAEKVPLNK